MRVEKDFKEFIELLSRNKARYLIRSKRKLGRKQDLADIEKLEKI